MRCRNCPDVQRRGAKQNQKRPDDAGRVRSGRFSAALDGFGNCRGEWQYPWAGVGRFHGALPGAPLDLAVAMVAIRAPRPALIDPPNFRRNAGSPARHLAAARGFPIQGKRLPRPRGSATRDSAVTSAHEKWRPHESDVVGVTLDEGLALRQRTFDLNPATVADVVHHLADGREIDAPCPSRKPSSFASFQIAARIPDYRLRHLARGVATSCKSTAFPIAR